MKRLLGVAAAALCLGATPALADTPAADQDLQCLMLFAMAAGQVQRGTDEFAANGMAVFYFLGKLDARDPAVDWLSEIPRRIELLTETNIDGVARRCDEEFEARATSMQNRGQQMVG